MPPFPLLTWGLGDADTPQGSRRDQFPVAARSRPINTVNTLSD